MYTDEELDQLEQEERGLTEEAILLLLAQLKLTKEELEKELTKFYQKYGNDGVVTYQEARKWVSDTDHQRRLTVLILAVNGAFDNLLHELSGIFDPMLKNVVNKEAEFFDEDLEGYELTDVPWGTDDLTGLERLEDDVLIWSVYVANDIKQALVRRKNIYDVLKQLDKRFMTMENVLEKLALTESTAIGSLARRKIFKKLGITKYRFYTREDERTCEVCGSMHGLIFPISAYEVGVTASPLHPRCRCWEVPIRD